MDTNIKTLIESYTDFNGSMEHLIIKTARIPRALIAAFVGSSLALSGVLMQAITKNPMASPSILGVNSGASFFLVLTISFFPSTSEYSLIWISFLGAFLAACLAYLLAGGTKGDVHTINLTLAGAAINFLFLSLAQGILAGDQRTLEETLFWMSGSVDGRSLETLLKVLPFMGIGLVIALLLSSKLNTFALGEDLAKGLGQNTWLVKLMAVASIVLLSGASVSVAGPITLVGLITPHIARSVVGYDYKWVIPYSALLGAIFLLLSDIGARFIIFPKEVPVGVVTALLGAPFFIYIARKAENK